MDMNDYRKQIDKVDDELLKLFSQRMDIAGQIAQYKKQHNLPVLDATREREKLADLSGKVREELATPAYMLYSTLFEISRAYQDSMLERSHPLGDDIKKALEDTPKVFPQRAIVACQGVEGAYSQLACDKIFAQPNIMYFTSFDAVFSAVRDGLCQYGVLPLENSTAGSVNMVYDLMMRYSFKIVKSVRLKVEHNLLVKKGVKKEEIREIFSHEQAIQQCAGYLKTFGNNVKITTVANTAEAAKKVAESDRSDVAALSSRACSKLYELDCAEGMVQDRDNNYTRFICISKNLEIYPGASRTSVMLTTAHKPGALYQVLGRIYARGINVVKLESRPLPGSDFEFMFYFDLETSIYSQEFTQLMVELEDMCEDFHYLGSYSEII